MGTASKDLSSSKANGDLNDVAEDVVLELSDRVFPPRSAVLSGFIRMAT